MNCKHAHKLINKSVDGLTSLEERAFLDEHLSTCPRCSAKYTAVASLDGLLAKALPLQETLGESFPTRVIERLPARRDRLSILKEELVMSRLKHAVVVAVVLAVVVGCLLAPRSRDSRAFAAVANAMAKVASLHYTSEPALPGTQNQRSEIWSTPSATKSVSGGVWYMWKQGTTYTYISRYKVLFISPAIGADTGVMFNSLVNPRMIADMNGVQSFHVKVRDVELDGRPMLRMEIDFTKDVTQEDRKESERLRKKIAEVISEREKREKPQSRVERVYEHEYVTHIRLIYTIDPSTNLVRSMDLYIPDNKNGGWRLVERFRSFEYNIDLPDDFFDVKTPPGTKVYDLRDEPNHEVGHNALPRARG